MTRSIEQLGMLYENIADHDHNNFLIRALPPTAPSLLAPKVLMMTTQSLLLKAPGVAEEVGIRGLKRQQERVMTTEYSATPLCLELRR